MERDQAKRALVERCCLSWESDLRAFLTGVLRDTQLAEEACQRTFVKALEAAATVSEATVRGWLFRIAFNEAQQIRREATRERQRLPRLAELAQQHGRQQLVESGLIREEITVAVRSAIRRLPRGQQQVVRERLIEGRAFSDIAERLDCPLGTVLTWMRRGLERLRQDARLRSALEGRTPERPDPEPPQPEGPDSESSEPERPVPQDPTGKGLDSNTGGETQLPG